MAVVFVCDRRFKNMCEVIVLPDSVIKKLPRNKVFPLDSETRVEIDGEAMSIRIVGSPATADIAKSESYWERKLSLVTESASATGVTRIPRILVRILGALHINTQGLVVESEHVNPDGPLPPWEEK